jgi:hypothetical protein
MKTAKDIRVPPTEPKIDLGIGNANQAIPWMMDRLIVDGLGTR